MNNKFKKYGRSEYWMRTLSLTFSLVFFWLIWMTVMYNIYLELPFYTTTSLDFQMIGIFIKTMGVSVLFFVKAPYMVIFNVFKHTFEAVMAMYYTIRLYLELEVLDDVREMLYEVGKYDMEGYTFQIVLSVIVPIIVGIVGLYIIFRYYQWLVYRLRDIGLHGMVSSLTLLPYIGIPIMIVLTLFPTDYFRRVTETESILDE